MKTLFRNLLRYASFSSHSALASLCLAGSLGSTLPSTPATLADFDLEPAAVAQEFAVEEMSANAKLDLTSLSRSAPAKVDAVGAASVPARVAADKPAGMAEEFTVEPVVNKLQAAARRVSHVVAVGTGDILYTLDDDVNRAIGASTLFDQPSVASGKFVTNALGEVVDTGIELPWKKYAAAFDTSDMAMMDWDESNKVATISVSGNLQSIEMATMALAATEASYEFDSTLLVASDLAEFAIQSRDQASQISQENFEPIPEPSSMLMMVFGMFFFGVHSRRQRRRARQMGTLGLSLTS
jgi:hypothetical protein